MWFESYLKNRKQQMCLNTSYYALSEPLVVRAGVPQGSILAPLLFSIYTIDLMNVVRHSSAHFYADDTRLIVLSPPQNSGTS